MVASALVLLLVMSIAGSSLLTAYGRRPGVTRVPNPVTTLVLQPPAAALTGSTFEVLLTLSIPPFASR